MIKDLKDLQKLFKLCRAQGITDFKMNDIEIKFGDSLQSQSTLQSQGEEQDIVDPYVDFPSNVMSPEQLSYYANGGKPENDPFNKEAI